MPSGVTPRSANTLSANKNTIIVLTTAAAIALAYIETWTSLARLWSKMDYSYSYGFVTLGLFLFELHKKKAALYSAIVRPSLITPALILLSSIAWLIATTLNLQIITELLLPLIIGLVIAAHFGYRAALKTAPALIYLLLSIPVWDYLVPYLQSLTTFVTSNLLSAAGLAIFIEGNRITIPYGAFEVAGGCSGLRYLLASLVLALFYSQQRANSVLTTVILFIVAIIFGIVANWIRVTLIIMIGYESEMQSPIVSDHDMFGWYVYLATLVPCGLLMNWIERRGQANTTINSFPLSQAPATAKTALPRMNTGIAIIVLLAILSGPMLNSYNYKLSNPDANHQQFSLSADSAGHWRSSHNPAARWHLNFPGSIPLTAVTFEHTASPHMRIRVNAIHYINQQQGNELVNTENTIANPEKWLISEAPLSLERPKSTSVIATTITNLRGQQFLIYSHYQVGKYTTSNGLIAKLFQLNSLISPSLFEGYLAYSAECLTDCEEESILLAKFVDTYTPRPSMLSTTDH